MNIYRGRCRGETELSPNHHTAISADAVDLKYILRQIEPDDRNPFHDPLLDVTFLVTTTLVEAAQDEAVHNITSVAT
jgi:hypothetical protein